MNLLNSMMFTVLYYLYFLDVILNSYIIVELEFCYSCSCRYVCMCMCGYVLISIHVFVMYICTPIFIFEHLCFMFLSYD